MGVGLALVVWSVLAGMPGVWSPLGPPGIDPSWRWAINHAIATGLRFGEDLAFTYGPLAHLIAPLDLGSNLLTGNLFLLAAQVALGVALAALALRRGWPVGLAAVLLLLAGSGALTVEGRLALVVVALAAAGLDRALPGGTAVAAALAGLLLLVKFSLGVTATGTVALAALLARPPGRARQAAAVAVAWLATFVVAAVATIGGPARIAAWLGRVWDIASGYGVAMSLEGPWHEPVIAAAILAGWGLLAIRAGRAGAWPPLPALLLVPLLLHFRLGFVRQDTHVLQFFGLLPAAIALLACVAGRRRELAAVVLAALAALAGVAAVAGRGPADAVSRATAALRGEVGLTNLANLARPSAVRRRLAEASRANLAPLRLPEPWRQRLAGGPVGVVPNELLLCPANDLAWHPTPTVQLYSGYSRSLDRWNASAFAPGEGPAFVIEEYPREGKRHPLLDAPATWRTLWTGYALVDVDEGRRLLLLERRPRPPGVTEREIGRAALPATGRGLPVPASRRPLLAAIDLRPTLLGRMQAAALRLPPLYLVFEHASGAFSAFRAIPGAAANGVLANCFPTDFRGYVALWRGECRDPVVALHLDGPGAPLFATPAPVTWLELAPPE